MINRREFLRKSALIATGVIAADQLELLEKLNYKKIWWTGFSSDKLITAPPFVLLKTFTLSYGIIQEMLEDDITYKASVESYKTLLQSIHETRV